MKYVSLDGLKNYLGDIYDAIEERYGDSLELRLKQCEIRMLAYIIPNTPVCEAQIEGFCNAVCAQLEYELGEANSQLNDMPNGITSFSVNGFSANLGNNTGDSVSNIGICKAARAELLFAGLLYRGVETC